jgi:MoaA/NifB/PqqE/SkfB family radical SAM enzyme
VERFLRTRLYEAVQWRLQTASLHTGRNLSLPTFVCLKLTMRCNARCLHCHIYRPENTPSDELTAAEWAVVLGRLRRWLGRGAPLTVTGGEILLRRDAWEVLACAAGHGFALHILTNGWLINPERADRLMQLGGRMVQVSLDGADPETHDFLRGLATFGERAESALAELATARDRRHAPTRLVVSTVIFNRNLDQLAALVRKVKALGVDEIKFQPLEPTLMAPPDPRWFEKSPLWIADPAEADRAIDELIAMKRAGWPIQNSVPQLTFYKQYFRDPIGAQQQAVSHDQSFGSRFCRSAVANFDMSSNGEVRTCYAMEPIGNVRQTDPEEIWNHRLRCWTVPCAYLAGPDGQAAS